MQYELLNISDYSRLYHGLTRLHAMERSRCLEMLYLLNTANLDTVRHMEHRSVSECSPRKFMELVTESPVPRCTMISLYARLERLESNIRWFSITEEQREACLQLKMVMDSLNKRYRAKYGVDIDDARLAVRNALSSLNYSQ